LLHEADAEQIRGAAIVFPMAWQSFGFYAVLVVSFLCCSRACAAETPEVARGRYLATLGDCIVCHTNTDADSAKFAGGYALHASPGTVYSSNITPDKETGIGNWNADQFYRAMNEGISADGRHLYPAFPYAYFAKLSRVDTDAIFAYLKTVKPVKSRPPSNRLIFPADIRSGMAVWDALFLDKRPFQPDPRKSREWNRGAEIVTGIGHCGACHSPKNVVFADEKGDSLDGTFVDGWFAPNITNTKRDGLGEWTKQEIVRFLKTGRSAHAWAGGSMEQVIEQSTSHVADADLAAIATYLKALPPAPVKPPRIAAANQMQAGQVTFVERCSICHTKTTANGYPTLVGNTLVQSQSPDTILRIILGGASTADTEGSGGGFSMPAFPVLSDEELADVATFIRNSWGNRADPVSANHVASLRKTLKAPE
jgi:mono/diheme cytochrome c family protein